MSNDTAYHLARQSNPTPTQAGSGGLPMALLALATAVFVTSLTETPPGRHLRSTHRSSGSRWPFTRRRETIRPCSS